MRYGLTDEQYDEMHDRAEKNAARILGAVCESVANQCPLLHRAKLKEYLGEVQRRFAIDIRPVRTKR